MHARERLFCAAECCADFDDKVLAVAADEVEFQHVVEAAVCLLRLGSVGEDLLDVGLVCAALGGEEFQSVAVVGEVARRDHDGAVRRCVLEDGRHEHGGRGGEHAVNAVCARVREAREDAVLDGECGDARVVADGDLQLGGFFARFLREEADEAHCDAVRRLGGEGDGLAFDPWDGNTADVAAVCELLEIIVCQWHWDSSFTVSSLLRGNGGTACGGRGALDGARSLTPRRRTPPPQRCRGCGRSGGGTPGSCTSHRRGP